MPGCEEDVANAGMDCNGTSVLDASHDGLSVPSVQFANAHVLSVTIDPVEFGIDPVNSNALKTLGVMCDDCFTVFEVSTANFGLEDGLGGDVSKVHVSIAIMVVQADNVAQLTLDQAHLGRVRAHVSNVESVAENDPGLDVIDSLASLAVAFTLIEIRVTFAAVRAWGVDTVLRASSGDLNTFIDVLASFAISHEFVSFVTFTSESFFGVDTFVIASIVLNASAFIDTTMQGFVAAIGAIFLFVTDQVIADAFLVVNTRDRLALELVVSARAVLAAVEFIAAISTIVFAVAFVIQTDTFGILTAEFIRLIALPINIFAVFGLIAAIPTVVVMIAFPALVDATTIVAFELIVGAFFKRHITIGNLGMVFISRVDTIRIAITDPVLINANPPAPLPVGLTSELGVRIASTRFALPVFAFVRSINTVIVAITNINPGNAIAIITSEQIPKASSAFLLTLILRLVFASVTIRVSIAIPSRRNAPMIRTPERVRWARPSTTMQLIFIRVVTTIIVSITKPIRLDTDGRIRTLDMSIRTINISILARLQRLIAGRIVLAVVDTIANLGVSDASKVFASELIRAAVFVITV